jgi:hypothetical protein
MLQVRKFSFSLLIIPVSVFWVDYLLQFCWVEKEIVVLV